LKEIKYVCPLCSREVLELTDHHLIPRSLGGKKIISICPECHRSIHAFFTNKELAKKYNNIITLLSDEKFLKHIKWISKQNPNRKYKIKQKRKKKQEFIELGS
jgi:5-methylcytosine-specific restriction protein A